MLRSHRATLIVAIGCVVACAAFCIGATQGPREVELSWDDGSAEQGASELAGQKLAVGFYAPEAALSLIGVRFYIMDDGLVNPEDPQLPTTKPFTVWVWRVGSGGEPGPAANAGYTPFPGYGEYPEDAWVDVVFPAPIDLSDEEQFPSHRFYVGLEWEHRRNPVVGLDLDAPISCETRYWNWSTWVVVDTADALIRAVVSDSLVVPVDARSWGQVKSEYR